jgi:CBS domain-containing protein
VINQIIDDLSFSIDNSLKKSLLMTSVMGCQVDVLHLYNPQNSEAMKTTAIHKLMAKNLIKLNLSDSLTKAESLLKSNNIRHLPVVSGDKIVGMLSYNDLLRISFADSADDDGDTIETTVYDMFTLEQVMSKQVSYVNASDSIEVAAELFIKENFHALPVLENDKLVGILTTTDMIRYYNSKCK